MAFTDPQKNVQQFSLGEGWHVADLGVGSGAYTLAAAERVGPEGRVYAIDVQKDLLSRVSREVHERGLKNIEIIWGDIEEVGGSKLQDGSMDAAIISNILFQVGSRRGLVEEVRRILKQKGRVLVVDWTGSFGGLGPHEEHVVSEEEAKKLFTDAHFEYERNIQAGEHHWGMIFRK